MLCQNCGQSNDNGQNYCRHCGAPLVLPQRRANVPPPKPYGWASPSSPLHNVADGENQAGSQLIQPVASSNYQPPPALAQMPNSPIMQHLVGYHCPRCGTTAAPIVQSRISTGGWVVFVSMLLFCFPLFFIGLLMREDYRVCPICLAQIG